MLAYNNFPLKYHDYCKYHKLAVIATGDMVKISLRILMLLCNN